MVPKTVRQPRCVVGAKSLLRGTVRFVRQESGRVPSPGRCQLPCITHQSGSGSRDWCIQAQHALPRPVPPQFPNIESAMLRAPPQVIGMWSVALGLLRCGLVWWWSFLSWRFPACARGDGMPSSGSRVATRCGTLRHVATRGMGGRRRVPCSMLAQAMSTGLLGLFVWDGNGTCGRRQGHLG